MKHKKSLFCTLTISGLMIIVLVCFAKLNPEAFRAFTFCYALYGFGSSVVHLDRWLSK